MTRILLGVVLFEHFVKRVYNYDVTRLRASPRHGGQRCFSRTGFLLSLFSVTEFFSRTVGVWPPLSLKTGEASQGEHPLTRSCFEKRKPTRIAEGAPRGDGGVHRNGGMGVSTPIRNSVKFQISPKNYPESEESENKKIHAGLWLKHVEIISGSTVNPRSCLPYICANQRPPGCKIPAPAL